MALQAAEKSANIWITVEERRFSSLPWAKPNGPRKAFATSAGFSPCGRFLARMEFFRSLFSHTVPGRSDRESFSPSQLPERTVSAASSRLASSSGMKSASAIRQISSNCW